MKKKYQRHLKIALNVAITVFIGMLLTILPLPHQLNWFYPSWVLMILIFWLIFFPTYVNLFIFWVVGFLMDLLTGSLIGQTAFIFVINAYIVLRFFDRFASFVLWRQSVVIFFLTGIDMLLTYCINMLTGDASLHIFYFSTPILNLFLWPILLLSLTYFYHKSLVRR